MSLFQGKMYNSRKKEVGAPEGNKNAEKKQLPQSEVVVSTAEALAKETGVSEKTVKRNAKYADAVETLGVEKKVIDGNYINISRRFFLFN